MLVHLKRRGKVQTFTTLVPKVLECANSCSHTGCDNHCVCLGLEEDDEQSEQIAPLSTFYKLVRSWKMPGLHERQQ